MELDDLRKKVDSIDARIVELINERAKVARQIGKVKQANSEPIYMPSREEIVYRKIDGMSQGPMPRASLRAIYREIMGGCLALQRPPRVAYLGPAGTFTHSAAQSKFGESAHYMPVDTINRVFSEVERDRADYGVVPVENSTGGGIHETLTRFLDSPLTVCAEIVMGIHHALLAHCAPEDIRRIYSKTEVFSQVRHWLQDNMPNVELRQAPSTSAAAEMAAAEQGAAAIGSASLGPPNGLTVLYENIEDFSHNVTRFFVLGTQKCEATGDDKTAVLCSVKDKVGALHDLLAPFKDYAINMTKIESFPSPTAPWQYYFFVDFLGHPDEEKTRLALDVMEEECLMLKVLGAFPRCTA